MPLLILIPTPPPHPQWTSRILWQMNWIKKNPSRALNDQVTTLSPLLHWATCSVLYLLQRGDELINELSIQQGRKDFGSHPLLRGNTEKHFVCSTFFPAPLRNMLCFSLIYFIITVSFYRVACLWLRKHLTCEHTPVPSLTLKPELFQRHMSTLFHQYFTITSSSLPLGGVCSTSQITKIQMKETIISWAKNKTVDSTLGQSENFSGIPHSIGFTPIGSAQRCKFRQAYMKWSHTVERIKINASDANYFLCHIPNEVRSITLDMPSSDGLWGLFTLKTFVGFLSTVCFSSEQHSSIGFASAGSAWRC